MVLFCGSRSLETKKKHAADVKNSAIRWHIHSPETNSSPKKNGWLEDFSFPFGGNLAIFRGFYLLLLSGIVKAQLLGCHQETRWIGSWRKSLKGWWEAPRWCHWQCLDTPRLHGDPPRPMAMSRVQDAKKKNVCWQCCISIRVKPFLLMNDIEWICANCWPICLHLQIENNWKEFRT